jgi:hypothetical protein
VAEVLFSDAQVFAGDFSDDSDMAGRFELTAFVPDQ